MDLDKVESDAGSHVWSVGRLYVNTMDRINYEPFACYIFDCGYWDLNRLFRIELQNSFFVIRVKYKPQFEVIAGEDLLEGPDNILRDQTVLFTTKGNARNYPSEIRRIVYFEPELKRTFTYYTNNFYLKAKLYQIKGLH